MSAERTYYGMKAACKYCQQDIEFHGKQTGWVDRGNNRGCAVFYDSVKQEFVKPNTKHKK